MLFSAACVYLPELVETPDRLQCFVLLSWAHTDTVYRPNRLYWFSCFCSISPLIDGFIAVCHSPSRSQPKSQHSMAMKVPVQAIAIWLSGKLHRNEKKFNLRAIITSLLIQEIPTITLLNVLIFVCFSVMYQMWDSSDTLYILPVSITRRQSDHHLPGKSGH